MVFVGMTKLTAITSSMLKPVKKVNINSDYNQQTHNVDIAILELQSALVFNDKIQPVNLPSGSDKVPVGSYAYASGWGKLSENGESATQLQGVEIQLLAADKCSGYSNFDADNMQCAGALDGSVDTCQVNNKILKNHFG